MNNKKMEVYYDAEADILEIFIGEPTPSYYDEIADDLFEGHDEKTDELKGYKILNFLKRGGMKNVRIPLPANVIIESED